MNREIEHFIQQVTNGVRRWLCVGKTTHALSSGHWDMSGSALLSDNGTFVILQTIKGVPLPQDNA